MLKQRRLERSRDHHQASHLSILPRPDQCAGHMWLGRPRDLDLQDRPPCGGHVPAAFVTKVFDDLMRVGACALALAG